MRRAWLPISAVLLMGTGCATTSAQQKTPPTHVDFAPVTVTGDARLARMNDEELFAEASAAFSANDFARAATLYGRIVDAFPDSRHRAQAALSAGISEEQLKNWEAARARFSVISDPAKGTGDALDGAFHLAEAEYQLGAYPEAALLLGAIADRTDLALEQRVEARVQEGICQVESGEPDRAESTLRQALAVWQSAPHPEDVDTYFPGQAEFFLGEIYRLHEEDVALDPDQTADALGQQLEYKAELLLSAQGHYLRAIRIGNGYWATAAGAQVGSMYEGLYRYLSTAPTPKELDAEQTDLYRQEVRKKIRVLLTKAISIYESTLDAADRLGTSGPFVERSRSELERLKALLVSEDTEPTPAPNDGTEKKTPVRHPESLGPQSRRDSTHPSATTHA